MPADPQASTSGSSPTMSHRKAVLNIPEGNQSIIEAHELDPAEERSGDAKKDYLEALKVCCGIEVAIKQRHDL